MKRQSRLLLLLVLLVTVYLPAVATDIESVAKPQELSAEYSQQVLKKVFAGTDFHQEKMVSRLRPRDKSAEDFDEEEIPEWLILLVEWLEVRDFGESESDKSDTSMTLVQVLEVLLWLLVIAVLAWLLYRYRSLIGSWGTFTNSQSAPVAAAEVLFGLDLRQQSLPKDVPAQVLQLWQGGLKREAIGLLYRASLSKLIHQYNFDFHHGHTERECAAIVAATQKGPLSVYIDDLTATWTRLAYAHREPTEVQVRELCQHWSQVFTATADLNSEAESA